MKDLIRKHARLIHFLPGIVILIVGMAAIHSSVKLETEHNMLEQHFAMLAGHYSSLTGTEDVAETKAIKVLSQRIQERETWLYWSVIAIGLTAFVLLILNANKVGELEKLNEDKLKSYRLLKDRVAAIEASVEGIGIVDRKGRLTYMNKALMELHGINPKQKADYIGKTWLSLYEEDTREYITKTVMPEFKETKFWRGESKIKHQGGKEITAELSMTRIEGGGFISTARDVSEREKAHAEKKEMETQLSQAQKMEAIGRLAGGIAHDFNNILAAMNGYAEFLCEDLEKGTDQHKFATNIMQAGKQARSLVDKILAFSRHKESDIELVDLCEPLQETLVMLQSTMPKTVEVKTDIQMASAPIRGNETQITQMIMNLCVNARDAMEGDKGEINIVLEELNSQKGVPANLVSDKLPSPDEAPPMTIEDGKSGQTLLYMGSIAKDQQYMRLSVSDTGSGISRVIMEHIFEPFFTTKDEYKGTGLGLSTVHGIVRAHQGALCLDSVLGEGTRFDLYFPLDFDGDATDFDEDDQELDLELGGMILLVEDQPEVQMVTETMLTRLGYDVECVSTGLEALDTLREYPEKYDVVVTDQNMPKMTGLELVNQANMDFPDLSFVLLSGYSQQKLQKLMEEHPAIKEMVRKPVSQKDLGRALQRVILADRDENNSAREEVA